MKQRSMAIIGIAVTVFLMAALAYSVYWYSSNPEDSAGMIAMGMISSGMMVFLVIFALIYSKPKPSDEYMEIYQGICSRCGSRFGEDGVCPGCGRVRPKM